MKVGKSGKKKKKVVKPQPPRKKFCDFCGQVDKSFNDERKLEEHVWKECPMLTVCKHCNYIIEVSNFTQHLVSKCTKMKMYNTCETCALSVQKKMMEEHHQEKYCRTLEDV